MNYLQDRVAYSTSTITLQPELPEILPTPPQPQPWDPGKTFENAKKSVTRAYQGIADFLIWFFAVFVPIFAPPMFVVWLIWKARRRNKAAKPTHSIDYENRA